jgi:hypothetical protein
MAKTKKFKLVRKTQTLELTGDFEGGEIEVVSSTPISFAVKILGMDENTAGEQEALIREFGDHVLISWNFVNENDEDIPANGDGMVSIDADTFNALMQAWTQRNVTGENLDEPSTEADTSV